MTRAALASHFEQLLASLLPRAQLQILEHGNPAVLRAEIQITFLPDKTEASLDMLLVPEFPRASQTCNLTFPHPP